MNGYFDAFLATVEERFPDDSSKTTMLEWLTKNTQLRRKPYTLKGFEFQERIVNDLHPDLSVIKPSQVGLTETQIRKYLAWLRRTPAITGIYSMPGDKMRDKISQTRIGPLVSGTPAFNPQVTTKQVRHKGLYQIGDSFGYVTGATEGDATSTPADLLMHDELDLRMGLILAQRCNRRPSVKASRGGRR